MIESGRTRTAAIAVIAMLADGALASSALAQDAPVTPRAVIEGTWQTQKKSEITIVPCSTGFCGRISRIVVPQEYIDKYGADLEKIGDNFLDYNNQDPALRNRPIQDLEILQVHAGGDPSVFDGQVYNPEDGNIYSGYVQVMDPDRIKLNGCVLYNLICLGEEWVRVPEPIPVEAAAGAPVPAEAALRPH